MEPSDGLKYHINESMTIGEIYQILNNIKQEVFNKISEISSIEVPYDLDIGNLVIPLIETSEIGMKGKRYIFGPPNFESYIRFNTKLSKEF